MSSISKSKKSAEKNKPQPHLSNDDINSQFEVELCWCIQQLEMILTENKLNPAKTKDAMKALNVLTNNTQPIIKKRQIMNLTFKDYRAKMAEEEKKLSRVNQQIKFMDKPNMNSIFMKKSTHRTNVDDFRFNFKLQNDVNCSKDKNEKKSSNPVEADNFKYETSGNSFRFNFDLNNDISAST